jgi:hypothetical protein
MGFRMGHSDVLNSIRLRVSLFIRLLMAVLSHPIDLHIIETLLGIMTPSAAPHPCGPSALILTRTAYTPEYPAAAPPGGSGEGLNSWSFGFLTPQLYHGASVPISDSFVRF